MKRFLMVLITTLLVGVGGQWGFAQDDLTVQTTQGLAKGKLINQGQVKAFLGLPYAAAPVGDLRWRAPEAAAKWS
jgi:para-nitrobenzyl esterase